MIKKLIEKIKKNNAVIGIIGMGYVGLPLTIAFTNKHFKVVGFDIDPIKIDKLNSNISPIKGINHTDIADIRKKGLFSITSDFTKISEVDVVIICVPTPLNKYRQPDLGPIISTGNSIAENLSGQLIILESSTYPGTTDEELKQVIESYKKIEGQDFALAYSPEREDPGNKDFSTSSIPKVVGADSEDVLEATTLLYESVIGKVIPVSSTRTAEAVKLTENIFRSVNIALVNELKIIFDAMDIDVHEVIDAAATKPFGFMPFYPGPGLGGHCIPIDPFYLSYKAKEFNINTRFIELAGEINTYMPIYVVSNIENALSQHQSKSVNGSNILLIGMAYKKDIDDMRESPSLVLTELLESKGASVHFHDSNITTIPLTREHASLAGRKSIKLTPETISSYDLVLIVTDHSDVDYQLLVDSARIIVDTRNVLKDFRGLATVIKS